MSAIPGRISLDAEQGQEPVRGLAPPGSRLGEVLERGEEREALPAALGGDLRQLLERRDVRDLVQREQHPRCAGPGSRWALVRRAPDLRQQPADERRGGGLLLGGRVDVDGVVGATNAGGSKFGSRATRERAARRCRRPARQRRRRRSRSARGPPCSATRPASRTPAASRRSRSSSIPGSSSLVAQHPVEHRLHLAPVRPRRRARAARAAPARARTSATGRWCPPRRSGGTIARAINSACVPRPRAGEQRRPAQLARQHQPSALRRSGRTSTPSPTAPARPRSRASTSGLVEVDTTGPGARSAPG